jgi:hypothetical protein
MAAHGAWPRSPGQVRRVIGQRVAQIELAKHQEVQRERAALIPVGHPAADAIGPASTRLNIPSGEYGSRPPPRVCSRLSNPPTCSRFLPSRSADAGASSGRLGLEAVHRRERNWSWRAFQSIVEIRPIAPFKDGSYATVSQGLQNNEPVVANCFLENRSNPFANEIYGFVKALS